ncbi:hypothetical protein [Algoriphagus sp.]|uniref:hypothetical protein n=1 Tax=Algoriphagus sp. TaxID=1872435 RepID=UPI0039193771
MNRNSALAHSRWKLRVKFISMNRNVALASSRQISKSRKHHHKKTFQKEYEEFIVKYGFERFCDK